MAHQVGEATDNTAILVEGRRAEDDSREFAAEVARCRAELLAIAAMLAQDRDDADDLVQETVERAILARHRFTPGTNLRAWLKTILRHLFFDLRRRARFTVPLSGETRSRSVEEALGPLDLLTVEDAREAMQGLGPSSAEIMRLAHFEGLSYRDIAARLNIPINTAASRLFRARTQLRPMLEVVLESRLRAIGCRQ
jgi:RNA polymerase sigma-70 factor (ECF subfamily)